MSKPKDIEQLLNELNEMQNQFNNLSNELIIKKNKKKIIKTNLSSKEIDGDFFNTFLLPKKEINKEEKPVKIKEKDTSKMFFDIDVKQDKIVTIDEKKSNLKAVDTKDINLKTPKSNNLINKQNKIEENKFIEKGQSYNSIKEKLKKIQKEIAERELKINNITNIKENKTETKNNLQQKTISKDVSLKKQQISKTKKFNLQKNDLLEKNVLKPAKKNLREVKNDLNTKSEDILKFQKQTYKSSSNNVERELLPKSSIYNAGIKNKQKKDSDSVDLLTIIILVLVIVLLGVAWYVMK